MPAHPIRPDSYIEMNNFYTLTVYEKGSEVIGMLKTLIGAEAFVNMAVVMGMVPTKGLALPFISYGGSSLIALGLALAAFSKGQDAASRQALERLLALGPGAPAYQAAQAQLDQAKAQLIRDWLKRLALQGEFVPDAVQITTTFSAGIGAACMASRFSNIDLVIL